MQKLKMKYVMLLGIFLFSSCGSLPKSPKIEICSHNEPSQEVDCFDTQNDEYRVLHINETDKYMMFSPDDWGLILEYVRLLEKKVKNKRVKSEINKVIKTTNKVINYEKN